MSVFKTAVGVDYDMMISHDDLALATDYYELTMAAAYFGAHQKDRLGIFELFVRKLPKNRSYMVVAGLEQALDYLKKLRFTDDAIKFLKSDESFKKLGEDFFDYLRNFKFTCDVWSVPEGSIMFPNEPILRVEGPIIEAQIVETFLLSIINFESLIATKASRITNVSGGKKVIEFGFRRAHGPQAALLAARASFIGGCVGTSNTLAGYKLGIPIFGTMAHSFILNFENEIDAFREFSKVFPNSMLLVDTYDTLEAVKKIVKAGMKMKGIRLDSGNLYELSVESRKILDDAGYRDAEIMASGDLNEFIIDDLIRNGAPIDIFGVGTELTTSRDDPSMNGVYKLTAVRAPIGNDQYQLIHKIKRSPGKLTYPGPKQVYRVFDNNMIKHDIIGFDDELFEDENILPQLNKVMENGKTYSLPNLVDIRKFHLAEREKLPPSFKSIDSTQQNFPVSYSKRLQKVVSEFESRYN